MKMTSQPKKGQRAKAHGSKVRMKTTDGKRVTATRRSKGRTRLST